MHIRRARPDDRAVILAFRREVYDGDPDGEAEIDGVFDAPRIAMFIAEDVDGTPLGFVEAGLRDYAEGCVTSPVGYIEGIYVVPEARQRGVARALLAAAERWAATEMGCREMASDTRIDNVISERAHLAAGYEVAERVVCFRKSIGREGSDGT